MAPIGDSGRRVRSLVPLTLVLAGTA